MSNTEQLTAKEKYQHAPTTPIHINHWEKGERGVSCKKLSDEVNEYTGDAVVDSFFGLRMKIDYKSVIFPASFEGLHICDIQYGANFKNTAQSFALGLKDAWNGTIAKGLDPEKMEELWNALDRAMDFLGEKIDCGQYSEWKQLLRSAKIK